MAGKDAGFSLIELMTVLAILAITLALGLPSLAEAMQRQRVSSTLHRLASDMAMARSSAVMGRARVVICPLADANHCAEGQDWSHGWIVFNDADGSAQAESEVDILRVTQPPESAVLSLPASRARLRFQPDGRAANANLTVYVCQDGFYFGKAVVNNLGRVRTERTTATDAPFPRA